MTLIKVTFDNSAQDRVVRPERYAGELATARVKWRTCDAQRPVRAADGASAGLVCKC
ncbi:MAG: hypothetical protein ACRDQZ_23400 [Mycobacteriales bacterium]